MSIASIALDETADYLIAARAISLLKEHIAGKTLETFWIGKHTYPVSITPLGPNDVHLRIYKPDKANECNVVCNPPLFATYLTIKLDPMTDTFTQIRWRAK